MQTRVLTGITTTGTPHLGNYVGAIRPAVAASQRADVDAFYFMADYHALIKSDDRGADRALAAGDRGDLAGRRARSGSGSRSIGSRIFRRFPS